MCELYERVIRYALHKPDPRLANLVRCYWFMETDRAHATKHQWVFPDGYNEIVFVLDGGYDYRAIDSTTTISFSQSVVSGVSLQSFYSGAFAAARLIGVKLFPGVLPTLLPEVAGTIGDQAVAMADLERRWLRELEARLAESAVTHAAAVQMLNRALLTRFAQQPIPAESEVVVRLISAQLARQPNRRIADVAQAFGLSVRSAERYFKASSGITPKNLARVLRFKLWYKGAQRRRSFDRRTPESLYYDQNHMIREFKRIAGMTPGQHAREVRGTSDFIVTTGTTALREH